MKTKAYYEVGYKRPCWKHLEHEISNEYMRTRGEAELERRHLQKHGFIQTYIKKLKG